MSTGAASVDAMASAAPVDLRRRRGEATRARILAVAGELFAARGFDATSTHEIAAGADITVAAIYRHFPSKAELLVAVAHDALETTFAETIDAGEALTAERVSDIVVAYVAPERATTRRLVIELTHAAANHPDVAAALQHFHARAREHIAAVLGATRLPVDPTLAARDVLLLMMGVCHIDALDPSAIADPAWQRSLRASVDAIIGRT